MCTMNRMGARLFGPDGCQVPIGKGVCGETRTLDIINEFKRLYEEKMKEIDNNGGGDCLQEKIKLQQDWIGDLTDQNEMLVRAVEELEVEATERVNMLEEKLQQSAKCIGEEEKKIKDRECTIRELHLKLGDVNELSKELHSKKQECDALQKNLIDVRQALTEEVASKHDIILKLKKDCQELEDRCIQADKQTAFRDDIIKELRKEIKQLKQQVSLPEIPSKSNPTECVRKSSNKEHVLLINHTKKIVQSGRSTVIYLQHGSDHKVEDKKVKNVFEDHTSNCSKCRRKLKSEKEDDVELTGGNSKVNNIGDESRLHLCKSENDLIDFKKLLRPVKERSKLTNGSFSRCNTFVGSTADALKNVDFESRLKHRNVIVPSNVPVKSYINHLEVNKDE